jgi:hypothetical protein
MPRMEDLCWRANSATEESKGVTLGLPSVQTVNTLLQHDWFRTVTMEAPVSQCTHYEEMKQLVHDAGK